MSEEALRLFGVKAGTWTLTVRRGVLGERVELLVNDASRTQLATLQRILNMRSPVRIDLTAGPVAPTRPWFVDLRQQHLGTPAGPQGARTVAHL